MERNKLRLKRKRRIRAKVFGTAQRPRLCVFKSLKIIYAQVIDDERGSTLAAVDSREIKGKAGKKKETAEKQAQCLPRNAKRSEYKKWSLTEADINFTERLSHWLKARRKSHLNFKNKII